MAERRNPFTNNRINQDQRVASRVGEFITTVRKAEVGHNFSEFAKRIGMNELEYANWESGRNGRINPEQIEHWANKLEFDNHTAINFYFSANHRLPEERDAEIRREWELAVYRAKYEGAEHPLTGAMRELLDNQPTLIKVINGFSRLLRK